MNNTYAGWHVLYVKSRHEKKVDLVFQELNLEAFLPIVTTTRQWSDRKKKIQKPLFPGYIFLKINSKEDYKKALEVNGVFRYLKFGDVLAKVKNEEIIKIKNILNLPEISDVSSSYKVPAIGERMKIEIGLLKGLECTVVKANNKNKIFVQIGSIKQIISACVPVSFLNPL